MSIAISTLLKTTAGQMLPALAGVLEKGAAHAQARGISEDVLVNARLYPDMFALSRQVQIASDVVARGAARLAAVEAPSFPDEEKTFADLIARATAANDYIQGVASAALDESAERSVTFPTGPDTTMTLKGAQYLLTFVLPNHYFHVTTAYAILRHNGVDIGKHAYLGVK